MDKTVPQAAGFILDFLGNIEAPKGYNVVYGNNQGKLSKPLTQMTLGEVIAAGPTWTKKWKSSAAGRYQFMNATLKTLKTQLGLRDTQVFNADLQDRLGFHLLRGRGYDKWAAGTMTNAAFALGLAKEWASIPVLGSMKGASRNIVRGQSYYAGDALNKSLVKPEAVEEMLIQASKLSKSIPVLPASVVKETPAVPIIDAVIPVKEDVAPVPGMEQAGEGNALLGAISAAAGKLRAINPEQAASLFRTGLQIFGTYLTTHGIIANEDWQQMLGPLVIVATTIWGLWARSDSNLLASAAQVPAVKAVVVEDPTVTAAVGDHRVTTEDRAREQGLL